METQTATKLQEPTAGPGLEPETILPSQFFDRFQIDASLQPEKRLMLAVLEDAVGTFQKYVGVSTRRGQRLLGEVEEWFAEPASEWPFGFETICQALNLEPAYLRTGLERWRDAQRAELVSSAKVVRFPFRRVNGRRHSITGRPVGLRRSA
jgi:hypothetical protein